MDLNRFKDEVLQHKNKMYRFALSFLKNQEEAKDLVQEVMLKVWDDRKNLEEVKCLEAWCMTMIRNKSLDRLKSARIRLASDHTPDDLYYMEGSSGNPFNSFSEKEMIDRVKCEMQKLPEKQGTAFYLRDFQEYSYKEIAEVLKVDINQVKVLIHRGRTTIKERLQKINEYGLR